MSIGTVVWLLMFLTRVMAFFVVMPFCSDNSLALIRVGPSAIGSEKGIWISMNEAPDFAIARAVFSDSFRFGYPATMCVINFIGGFMLGRS